MAWRARNALSDMANFIALIDPDPARRQRFANATAGILAPVAGLSLGAADGEHIAIRWAAAPTAPVSSHRTADDVAVLWGQAVDPDGITLDAPALATRWNARGAEPPFAHDGFHAALVSSSRGETIVAGDLLGFFPIYYAQLGPVLLVGSSPELFQHHPLFRVEPDAASLVTLLVATAPLDGAALLKGVRRLAQSHALIFRPHEGSCREVRQFELLEPTADAGASFDEYAAALDHAVSDSVRRLVGDDRAHTLLLTGGRDSRFLGGYLRQHRRSFNALTLAERDDYEAQCAHDVARALGVAWHRSSPNVRDFSEAASRQARWEHLGGGFDLGALSLASSPLRSLGSPCISGLLLDITLSGRPVWPHPAPFEKLLAGLAGRTVAPDDLTGLLTPALSDLPRETVQRMRALHAHASEVGALRTWRYQLAHAEPFTVGSYAWRIAFGAWPILPVLSRAYLETCTSLPAVTLSNRRAQDALMRKRFPDLARIELVQSNAGLAPPLMPAPGYRIRAMVRAAGGLLPGVSSAAETRQRELNQRLYDFDNDGWRAIRAAAEPSRPLLEPFFDMTALANYLPAPTVAVPTADRVTGTRGRKMIIGLMLWAGEHFG